MKNGVPLRIRRSNSCFSEAREVANPLEIQHFQGVQLYPIDGCPRAPAVRFPSPGEGNQSRAGGMGIGTANDASVDTRILWLARLFECAT